MKHNDDSEELIKSITISITPHHTHSLDSLPPILPLRVVRLEVVHFGVPLALLLELNAVLVGLDVDLRDLRAVRVELSPAVAVGLTIRHREHVADAELLATAVLSRTDGDDQGRIVDEADETRRVHLRHQRVVVHPRTIR